MSDEVVATVVVVEAVVAASDRDGSFGDVQE